MPIIQCGQFDVARKREMSPATVRTSGVLEVTVTIRADQFNTLLMAHEVNFKRRISTHLRMNTSTVFGRMSENDVARFVDAGVQTARAHGFRWESSIATFVYLMALVSPRFHESLEIANGLRDRRHSGEYALRFIVDELPENAWDAAAASDVPAAIRAFLDDLEK